MKEFAKCRLLRRLSHQHVFQTHTKFPRNVNTRLVAHRHSHVERHLCCCASIFANLVRTFVHTQMASHSVSSAVSEVVPLAPHGLSCCKIERKSCGSHWKMRHRELNHPFEHQRVGLLFLLSQRTKWNGARDVGSSTYIVRTAVKEKKTFVGKLRVIICRCFIVHDSTIACISCNCSKRQTAIFRIFSTNSFQSLRNAPFRFVVDATISNFFIQFSAKTHQCCTIEKHCLSKTLNLCVIFVRTPLSNRRNPMVGSPKPDGRLCDAFPQTIVDVESKEKSVLLLRRFVDKIQHPIIRMISRIDSFQIFPHLRSKMLLGDKQVHIFTSHDEISQKHRIICNVFSAQIEQPRYF